MKLYELLGTLTTTFCNSWPILNEFVSFWSKIWRLLKLKSLPFLLKWIAQVCKRFLTVVSSSFLWILRRNLNGKLHFSFSATYFVVTFSKIIIHFKYWHVNSINLANKKSGLGKFRSADDGVRNIFSRYEVCDDKGNSFIQKQEIVNPRLNIVPFSLKDCHE